MNKLLGFELTSKVIMSTVKDNKAKSLLDSFYQALIRHSPRISRKKLRKSVEKQASVAAATTTTKNSYSADQKPRPKSVYQFPDIVVDDYDYPGLSQSRHATQPSTTLQYLINTNLSQQWFWPYHENWLIKSIPIIPHYLHGSFKEASLYSVLRLILVYPNL